MAGETHGGQTRRRGFCWPRSDKGREQEGSPTKESGGREQEGSPKETLVHVAKGC